MMMKLPYSCLALAVAAGLCAVAPAHAGTLGPGESATLERGSDPTEIWGLDAATLIMNPGSAAGRVAGVNGSIVTINGGVLYQPSSTVSPLALGSGSSGTVRDAMISGGYTGVGLDGSATLDVADSTISGGENGVWLDLGSFTAENTQISNTNSGTGANDAALRFENRSTATLARGSSAKGSSHAATFYSGAFASSHALIVDASHLESGTGSALFARTSGPVYTNVDIELNNGTTVTAGNGVLLETQGALTRVNLNINNSVITGDILNDKAAGATARIGLRNAAILTGAMTDVTEVSVESAQWNVTGDSTVDALQLNSGGVIAFEAPMGGAHKTLTVGNFSGTDGTIVFNTVLADDASASDKLVVTGDTSGSANVRVNNIGGTGAQTVNGIELINVGGASDGVFSLAGRAVGGSYEYFLHKGGAGAGSEGNWYLRSELQDTPPLPCDPAAPVPGCTPVVVPGDPDPGNPDPGNPDPGNPDPGNPDPGNPDPGNPGNPDPILRPEGGAYLANLQAAQQMFAIGYHGRQQGQNGGRAWAKVDGSRNGFDAVSRQLDVRGNSQSLSVGANVWDNGNGSSAGVMLSSGNATSTSTNELTGYYARGKVKGESLGVYGTWRGGNAADPYAGFYVDGSVQRAQFRNRVEGVGLDAERYDSRAWQGAVEAGYAFRVGGASNGGLYLEPQLQVGYTRWNQGSHTEANGTVVQTEDANGVFGRAGVRLSGVTRWGNGVAEVQPYIAAHWVHSGTASQVTMNDEVVDARIPQNRGEFSAGASLKFGNGVGVFGGLSLQKASGYHQTSAQVGLNYSW